MKIPSEFDPIRPSEPEELPAVYDRILADKQFQTVPVYLYPDVPAGAIAKKMHACKTNLEFQKTFCYSFLRRLVAGLSLGCSMDAVNTDIRKRYTFVSNHRDIMPDSAFLDKPLMDVGFITTCEITVGDNLPLQDWVRDLVRINKSFTVERVLHSAEMLRASKRMSEYIHFVIAGKNDNVRIAQRQGRAKNSNDLTQPATLKMMATGGEGTIVKRLKQLYIVSLSISHEYDPCDYLKAREYQLRRDLPYRKKTAEDNLESMLVGIKGYKGCIFYKCAPRIDEWLDTVGEELPKNKLFDTTTAHIDHRIHSNYRLYPINYVALDIIQDTHVYEEYYTAEDYQNLNTYLDGQTEKIGIEDRDDEFSRTCLSMQYAYPTKNYIAAPSESGRFKSLLNRLTFKKQHNVDWFRNTLYRLLTMVTAVMSLLIASVYEYDFYETGDSESSYLYTGLVEARTNELSTFVSATTDDGTQLILKPVVKEQWTKRPDITYRALLYYNKVENGITLSSAISPVAVSRSRLAPDLPIVHTNPVGFESVWISKNHKYLNPILSLKIGKTEDEKAVQTLAIVCDPVKNLPNGGQVFYLRLHHYQNGVPEYYSRRVFTNIPLNDSRQQDSIYSSINTYKGKINEQIIL